MSLISQGFSIEKKKDHNREQAPSVIESLGTFLKKKSLGTVLNMLKDIMINQTVIHTMTLSN
jgi:hypothetical protein